MLRALNLAQPRVGFFLLPLVFLTGCRLFADYPFAQQAGVFDGDPIGGVSRGPWVFVAL